MVDFPPFPDNISELVDEQVDPQFETQKRLIESLDPLMTLTAAKRKLLQLSEKSESESVSNISLSGKLQIFYK